MAPQLFKANETKSGGAGADEEDGETVNAVHPFEFMGGRLATMIWEDGVRLVGGDDTNQSGNIIIADGDPGAGSSVPGGPGVRGSRGATAAPTFGDSDSCTSGSVRSNSGKTMSRKKSARSKKSTTSPKDQRLDVLHSKAQSVLDKLSSSMDEEAAGAGSAFGHVRAERDNDRVLEDLVDDVERLEEKVASAKTDKSRQRYQRLLQAAEARVEVAEAEADREAADAAASSTAGAPATASLPAAQSTAAPVRGGVDPLPLDELPAVARALATREGTGGT